MTPNTPPAFGTAGNPEAARLRLIGMSFRYLIQAVGLRWLISIGFNAMHLPPLLQLPISLGWLFATGVQGWAAFRLASALQKNIVLQIVLTLLAIIPCLDLIALVWLNSDSKVALEKAGIKVGFMGPDPKDLPAG
jgi:hypothetical protein